MEKLLEAVFRLDAAKDFVGLKDFVIKGRYNAVQIFVALEQLLHGVRFQSEARIQSAYLLAVILDQVGVRHTSVSLALSAGGLLFGNAEVNARGLQLLREQTKIPSPTEQRDNQLVRAVMVGLLNLILPKSGSLNNPLVIGIIEILKAASPPFRTVFDWQAPVPELSLEEMRSRRPETPLVTYPLPPADAPRPQRRVLIVSAPSMTLWMLRYEIAMNKYGWQAEIFTCPRPTEASAVDMCRIIKEICRQKSVDVLFLEAGPLAGMGGADAYTEMKAQLRQDNPSLRVLGLVCDSLGDAGEQSLLEWGFFDGLLLHHHDPLAPHMQNNPHYKEKILHEYLIPILDQTFGTTDRPLVPKMFFRGSIRNPHWARVLWLAAAGRAGLPLSQEINQFLDSNEPSRYDPSPSYKQWLLEDYTTYMRKHTEATCCISLVMFGNMVRYLTTRSFEVLLSGSLLVQEFTPFMHHHFIPGEHYLEFSTIAELSSIVRFITERREEAEEVRRRGHAFARERYNDARIIGQIDRLLYFNDSEKTVNSGN
ncbi:MAG: glycosyltransferase [Magnetococcus sp. MYC-9]